VGNKRKYSEKAKKVINFFRDLRSKIFGGKSGLKIIFRAGCLKVCTGTYFVTKRALSTWLHYNALHFIYVRKTLFI